MKLQLFDNGGGERSKACGSIVARSLVRAGGQCCMLVEEHVRAADCENCDLERSAMLGYARGNSVIRGPWK